MPRPLTFLLTKANPTELEPRTQGTHGQVDMTSDNDADRLEARTSSYPNHAPALRHIPEGSKPEQSRRRFPQTLKPRALRLQSSIHSSRSSPSAELPGIWTSQSAFTFCLGSRAKPRDVHVAGPSGAPRRFQVADEIDRGSSPPPVGDGGVVRWGEWLERGGRTTQVLGCLFQTPVDRRPRRIKALRSLRYHGIPEMARGDYFWTCCKHFPRLVVRPPSREEMVSSAALCSTLFFRFFLACLGTPARLPEPLHGASANPVALKCEPLDGNGQSGCCAGG